MISVKKWVLVVSLLVFVSLLLSNPIPARLNMRNGDIIECSVTMDRISFISDYGEFQMPMEFVKAIVFPTSGTIITSLKTIYKNEIFRGFLLEEYILADFEGIPMKFHKDTISWVELLVEDRDLEGGVVQVMLKTGEQFYAAMLSEGLNIQTSYGVFSLSMDNVALMEFEGEGNVLTKTTLLSGSEMRGIVQDDFIVVKLLSGAELSIAPGKIKTIDFSTIELAEAPEIKEIPDFLPGEEKKAEIPHNMVLVEKGTFYMGDLWTSGNSSGKPTFEVTFDYDYFIGKYEVTFEEYDEFFIHGGRQKPSDNGWGRASRPVINVSWWDAITYCNWLSTKEDLPVAYDDEGNFLDKDGNITTDPSMVMGYRLATEAEWEYAARGGKNNDSFMYSGSEEVDEVAWYRSNSENKTQPVGKKKPNSLGIYDMSGNVEEWCSDYYGSYTSSEKINPFANSGSGRVHRGGSWRSNATDVRVAYRGGLSPTYASNDLGFRIARTAP
ncbi:MAG TPA: SUMF1/EgtB/PvdO family nonheme iron enzyme [Mesotoga prima]|nr:SUMF1/EgtB/PvdO family nonheme iron enzyme [Mesotoga prima]